MCNRTRAREVTPEATVINKIRFISLTMGYVF